MPESVPGASLQLGYFPGIGQTLPGERESQSASAKYIFRTVDSSQWPLCLLLTFLHYKIRRLNCISHSETKTLTSCQKKWGVVSYSQRKLKSGGNFLSRWISHGSFSAFSLSWVSKIIVTYCNSENYFVGTSTELEFWLYFFSAGLHSVSADLKFDPDSGDSATVNLDLGAGREGSRTDDELVKREEEAIKLDGLSVAQLKEIREKADKFQFQVSSLFLYIISWIINARLTTINCFFATFRRRLAVWWNLSLTRSTGIRRFSFEN